MAVPITDWHDDFEPNYRSKQSQGSIVVYKVTILGPYRTKSKGRYMYYVFLGTKSRSYDHIFPKFQNKIKGLHDEKTHLIIEVLTKWRNSICFKFTWMQRKINVCLGNGQYSSWWGYAANDNDLFLKLPYFDNCLHRILVIIILRNVKCCSKCLGLNVDDTGNSLLGSYPPKTHPNSTTMSIPKKHLNI